MKFSPFEHKFIKTFRNYFDENGERYFCIGVSGGVDSIVLLFLFKKFSPLLKLNFKVVHVNHGYSQNLDLQNFRIQSQKLVESFCEKNSIPLCVETVTTLNSAVSLKNPIQSLEDTAHNLDSLELKSESDLRDFRYSCFKKSLNANEILVLAHHMDDLLESKLMDLLRGSHFDHWSNHKVWNQKVFRPLSEVPKSEIMDYAKVQKLDFVEDPTNSESESLRNWIRNTFLNDLDKKNTSYRQSLFLNLKKLYDFSRPEGDSVALDIPMESWVTLSDAEKKHFILKSSQSLGLKSMTQGQILDTLSKLDLRQKEIKFQTGPIFWTKTADRVYASKAASSMTSDMSRSSDEK